MAKIRFMALGKLAERKPATGTSWPRCSEIFGEDVFSSEKMRHYLSIEAFKKLERIMLDGTSIDRGLADQVAAAMKAWAVERGVTHYTHWFHPLNGATAEKHDSFVDVLPDGNVIESFDGRVLVQQEPDASSFPNGGIRNTFEARGYTAWDPGSPAFINNRTLCIPTVFVAYTGEALDFKTPMLKALALIDKAAVDICQYFDKDVTRVIATLGWEQEYFLVDEALYNARPDLKLCGRTLMGHSSAKDQQLEDQYFGAIPARVTSFMEELEYECHRLGIPIKTRHNEVAPNQFECAPIFEEANLAVDHNQLLMSTMKKVARRHDFRVLLHEKPYKGVNGSGKHNNWSLMTNTGVNLLSPGRNPKSNMQFLIFLVSTIKAVHEYSDLFKACIVSQGNEARLGGEEAPPVIMSVFLGAYLSGMLNELVEKVSSKKMSPDEKTELKLNVGKIPEIMLDNTDRNRTSPFAFTGNRFEFRAVGSSANCGGPMIVLNTAVAEQLVLFKRETDALIDKGVKKDEAIFQVLRKYIIESQSIRFEGNGYGQEWREEAARRGLSTDTDCIPALKAYLSDKARRLFVNSGVLSERELKARFEIKNEIYLKKLQIESRVLGDLALNHIIPIAIKYQNTLLDNVNGLKAAFADERVAEIQLEMIRTISLHIREIQTMVSDMTEARKQANALSDEVKRAEVYTAEVRPYLEKIRYHIDKLELLVDDEIWPLPKYRELLFSR
ncbi:glutamine synthetase III [Gabonibacter chumensis]|uniref:glutamine synthetase III family protein n=1 Tax=Gabonibacter chumensis TaxID=2972474 RepID=UPI002573E941|nr:glutamine synthetase III [Gabonibacter chumensis]MCR9010726.1 glutamine synthetase III [Gabonibacter chumensis]